MKDESCLHSVGIKILKGPVFAIAKHPLGEHPLGQTGPFSLNQQRVTATSRENGRGRRRWMATRQDLERWGKAYGIDDLDLEG
jgi:hypothetical protein